MRVIGGDFGGRRLKAPRGLDTRPTSDRVREALFMALEPLAGIRVVDLFAGSGAQGIEALSRGAEWVDFVESRSDARRVLSGNLIALGIESRARVWPLHLPDGLKRMEASLGAAGLILLDPPYGGELARSTLDALGRMRLLTSVRIAVEHHTRDEMPGHAGGLARCRERRYGETVVTMYENRTGAGPSGAAEGGKA